MLRAASLHLHAMETWLSIQPQKSRSQRREENLLSSSWPQDSGLLCWLCPTTLPITVGWGEEYSNFATDTLSVHCISHVFCAEKFHTAGELFITCLEGSLVGRFKVSQTVWGWSSRWVLLNRSENSVVDKSQDSSASKTTSIHWQEAALLVDGSTSLNVTITVLSGLPHFVSYVEYTFFLSVWTSPYLLDAFGHS